MSTSEAQHRRRIRAWTMYHWANSAFVTTVAAARIRSKQDRLYRMSSAEGARVELAFNGQKLTIVHSSGPDHGIWSVELGGRPLLDEDGRPVTINAYSAAARYENTVTLQAPAAGRHTLSLVNWGERDERSSGSRFGLAAVRVLPPLRRSNLGLILFFIVGLVLLARVDVAAGQEAARREESALEKSLD